MKRLEMLLYILLGNTLLAFAVCAFVVPNGFMLGGSTGIALVIQSWIPAPISVITAGVNLSLFLLGYLFLGKRFAMTSLCSTIIYPVILGIFETQPVGTWFSQDVLLSAVFAGVLMGSGIGLVIRAGGSTGGMDIPPCILQKLKGIPVGNSMVFFDIVILALQIFYGGWDGILYGIVVIVLTSGMMNRTILSGEKKVELIIISPRHQEIAQTVLKDLDSGMTFLNIETGYQKEKQKAIFSVVYAKQYPAFRDRVLAIDPSAFLVAAPVMNVNGRGYTLSRQA
ncbi:MAG: YitT family protein [Lachnospiraceae bacterium]|nr:YitT family protein [Lachnospiraceae bacterium]